MGADELAGMLVRIVVDRSESGDQGRFNIINGTICGSMRDRDGVLYHVVRLHEGPSPADKSPVAGGSKHTGEYFLVAPKFKGDTLLDVIRGEADEMLVGIARVVETSILGGDSFDFSQADYLAVGVLRFVSSP